MRRTLGVALAGLLLVGACGSDDDSSADDSSAESSDEELAEADRQAYVDAAVAALGEDEENGAMARDATACIATATIDAVGVDAFVDGGVTPDEFAESDDIGSLDLDLPENAVSDLAAGFEDCDLPNAFSTLLLAGFVQVTGEIPEGAQECLSGKFDNAQLAALAAEGTLTPSDERDSELNTLLAGALAACPDVLSDLLIGSYEAAFEKELAPESSTCIVAYVQANPQAVADGFLGLDQTGSNQLNADLMAACPTLATDMPAPPG